MPKRRKVLIGLGGSIAIAGCTGDTEDEESESEPEPEPEPEPEEESEPEPEEESDPVEEDEPPQAEFTEISPENATVEIGEEFEISAELVNTGGQTGEFDVELRIEGEIVSTGSFEREPEESGTVSVTINTGVLGEELGPGEYEHRFITEGDEISTTVTYVEPEPEEVEEPATQSFSGSGQSVEDGVEIEGGLTVVEASHSGERNFQVSLEDDSQYGDSFINVIGDFDGAQADLIDAGEYLLDVNADGSWSIDIHQPRSASGESLPQTLSGSGPDVIGPIQFDGTHVASGSHSGERNFQVRIYPMEGSFGEGVFNEIGEFDGETTFRFNEIGWVDINADGDWQITLE